MLVYDERSSRFRKALFPATIIANAELALSEGWRSAFVPSPPWVPFALLATEPASPVVKPKAGRRMSPLWRGPVRSTEKKRGSAWRRRPVPRRRPNRR